VADLDLQSLPTVTSNGTGTLSAVEPSNVLLLACHHYEQSPSADDVVVVRGQNFQVDSTFWLRDYGDAGLAQKLDCKVVQADVAQCQGARLQMCSWFQKTEGSLVSDDAQYGISLGNDSTLAVNLTLKASSIGGASCLEADAESQWQFLHSASLHTDLVAA